MSDQITRQAVDGLKEALELTRRRDQPTMRELHGLHKALEVELRKARAEGWDEAHADFCDYGSECSIHMNPHKDKP